MRDHDPMKVHILDDWFDTLMTLPSYARLSGHDVTIWNGHTKDVGVLAEHLAVAKALVLFRERPPITSVLLERLPKLKLISQRSCLGIPREHQITTLKIKFVASQD